MTGKGYFIKKKVLFIDLDDTIIKTISGNKFPIDVTDFKIRKEVLDKIVEVFPTLYYVEIVSNQGGIPQFVDEQDFIGKIKAIESFMIMIGDASGKDGDFSDSDKKCAENFGIEYIDVEDFLNM